MEYDPLNKSNSSFQAGAKILNLLLLYADLIFFHVQKMLKLTNAMFSLVSLRLTLLVNSKKNFLDSFVLIFSVFIKIISTFK